MLPDDWSGVSGEHFPLPCLHLVDQLCIQSDVSSSQPHFWGQIWGHLICMVVK